MKKIIGILEDPDYIYKISRRDKDYYYEKKIANKNYRVVITYYRAHVKKVVTAYEIENNNEFDKKHTCCIYDKNTSVPYNQLKAEQEGDLDYFIELFKES